MAIHVQELLLFRPTLERLRYDHRLLLYWRRLLLDGRFNLLGFALLGELLFLFVNQVLDQAILVKLLLVI